MKRVGLLLLVTIAIGLTEARILPNRVSVLNLCELNFKKENKDSFWRAFLR